ncbi:MAG: hypothetical protein M3M87_07525 [Thermoproteota archaeon]|nr:hypothetical protein [Thermoproteota archaeon]
MSQLINPHQYLNNISGHSFGGDKIISAKEDIEKSASMTETDDKKKITNKSQFKLAHEFESSGGNLNINGDSSGQQQPIKGASVRLFRKTQDNDNDKTALIIPKEFAKELDIGNSKVSMSLPDDFGGNRHLRVCKHYKEIVID